MTDELQPAPRGAPAGDPPAGAARRRALHGAAAGQGHRRPDAGARRAKIVRQSSTRAGSASSASSSSSLFVVVYWFYELGRAARASRSRASRQEIEHQQVIAVERGYNIYQANCARCHGPTGLGTEDPNAPSRATSARS